MKQKLRRLCIGTLAGLVGATTLVSAVPAFASDLTGKKGEVKEGSAILDLTADELKANDYVLYTANCGTPDPSVIPNPDTQRLGILQSSMDQELGEDAEKGTIWGCNLANEYSKAKKSGTDATDIGESFIYMSTDVTFDKYKSSLGYSFQVPEADQVIEGIEPNIYEVTVAFKHYWDGRDVNVLLEGQSVDTDVTLGYGSWVSRTYQIKVTDGELNVDIKAPRRTSTSGDPILNYIKVRAVEDTTPEIPNYTSITGADGAAMYDTNGVQIQAHGGQVQQLTVNGETKWYWIGEDKTYDYRPVGGIHVYSSTDLYNWDDEGVVLRSMESPEQFDTDEYFKSLYGDLTEKEQDAIFVDLDRNNTVMERPKMLYNDKTKQYVIWFHCDGRTEQSDSNYGKAKAGVAVSDNPAGPFRLIGSYKLDGVEGSPSQWNDPLGSVRDMNLFKDDDGTAYVIYSSDGNKTTYIAKLNDFYTGLAVEPDEAVEGTDFARAFIDWSREAPAIFKYNKKYYMINSGTSGWAPNPAQYFVSDNILGPWKAMGDPCTDEGADTTYATQSTCVIPVDPEKGKFIYMGDRWNADNLSDSRYVWLPIEFLPNDQIAIRRYSNWTLDELDNKGLFEVTTELPSAVDSIADIENVLPEEVEISYGNQTETTPVTWEIGTYENDKLGTVTVTGTLTEKKRVFSHDIHVVNPDTLYFFDSGAGMSAYFDAAKERLGDKLLNTAADEAYTETSKAGYLGHVRENNESDYDIGRHDGTTSLEKGWYAASGKSIEYKFTLEPGMYTLSTGFCEWWNTKRDMKIRVSDGERELSEKEFQLASSDRDLQINQTFEVKKAGVVTVSILKNTEKSADPVLSWIAVVKEGRSDRADLETLLKEAEEMDKTAYTDSTWNIFTTAYQAAQEVFSNLSSAPEAIKQALTDLEAAKAQLKTFKQLIEDEVAANTVSAEEKSKYTEESWSVYERMMQKVQEMLAKPELTAEDAQEALKILNDSKSILELKKEPSAPTITKQKADQTISYTEIYKKSYGCGAFTLDAKITAGDGRLTFVSTDPKVAAVTETGKVTIKGTGICTIMVSATGTENYNAKTVEVTLRVSPKKAAVKRVKAFGNRKLSVTWKKGSKVSGYQIQCSAKKNFKSGKKTLTVKKASRTSAKFAKLTRGKKYYVRVRAYKNVKVNGKTVKLYGAWSKAKRSAKIK